MKFPGKRPQNLGVSAGKLAPCSSKPNCVSSQASSPKHYVEPLGFADAAAAAMLKLKVVVEAMPLTAVIECRADYLYAEFSTPGLGFVDDVEFYCDGALIHVRSASRLGYSDLGVNRKRVEALRRAFAARA